MSELENLLEELIDIGEETDRWVEKDKTTGKKTIEDDKAKAMEMRKRAVETIGETREGNQGECDQEK